MNQFGSVDIIQLTCLGLSEIVGVFEKNKKFWEELIAYFP
jgi:hypothetical protein